MSEEKKLLSDEKDCADMLGMTLEEYRKSFENIKVQESHFIKEEDTPYEKVLLKEIELDESFLKKKNKNKGGSSHEK